MESVFRDNSGKFSSVKTSEVEIILNSEDQTTAGYSPFQNVWKNLPIETCNALWTEGTPP